VPNFISIGLGVLILWGVAFLASPWEREVAVNTWLELPFSLRLEDERSVTGLNGIVFHRIPVSELRSVTCHLGSHGVTCYPTQVNVPRLNPNHTGR